MKKTQWLLIIFSLAIFLWSCGKEESVIAPTSINLSNDAIYELLPQESIVAKLSTDVVDGNMRYLLVSGEGDTDNAQFEIKGDIFRTKQKLKHSDGGTRSVRIKATDGVSEYETAISVTIQKFEGTYPTISSSSFEHNESMPREFGADHGNISPDLNLADIPANTVSILLTMRDLDQGGNYHWTVWNIPPDKDRIFQQEMWSDQVVVGDNNYGEGYTGPFPPREHRYELAAIFLSETLSLEPNQYTILTSSLTGKMIAHASIIGKYKP